MRDIIKSLFDTHFEFQLLTKYLVSPLKMPVQRIAFVLLCFIFTFHLIKGEDDVDNSFVADSRCTSFKDKIEVKFNQSCLPILELVDNSAINQNNTFDFENFYSAIDVINCIYDVLEESSFYKEKEQECHKEMKKPSRPYEGALGCNTDLFLCAIKKIAKVCQDGQKQ
ncbi:hypothetical protein CHUAL_013320 [Chamberlinius hualienensis]